MVHIQQINKLLVHLVLVEYNVLRLDLEQPVVLEHICLAIQQHLHAVLAQLETSVQPRISNNSLVLLELILGPVHHNVQYAQLAMNVLIQPQRLHAQLENTAMMVRQLAQIAQMASHALVYKQVTPQNVDLQNIPQLIDKVVKPVMLAMHAHQVS